MMAALKECFLAVNTLFAKVPSQLDIFFYYHLVADELVRILALLVTSGERIISLSHG